MITYTNTSLSVFYYFKHVHIRSSQIFEELNWLPIKFDLKKGELMAFKALTGQAPGYLKELFIERNNDYYCLRSNSTNVSYDKGLLF